jgi:hypothetical protein
VEQPGRLLGGKCELRRGAESSEGHEVANLAKASLSDVRARSSGVRRGAQRVPG